MGCHPRQGERGAALLVSGPFDGDAHFHPTGREKQAGLAYETVPLEIREEVMKFPGGDERLSYGGDKTTYLDRAVLPDKSQWVEKTLGRGKILFSPLPLELNDNLQTIGDVYRYAMKTAAVAPAYTTTLQDPGILICPTRYPRATLYALTSESARRRRFRLRPEERETDFRYARSGPLGAASDRPGWRRAGVL